MYPNGGPWAATASGESTAAMNEALFSSATGVHHTPEHIIHAARAVTGAGIDLDPASSAAANRIVGATRYMCDPYAPELGITSDGLAHTRAWYAAKSIWLNPPFSTEKRDTAGALVVSARTGKPVRQHVIGAWVARWASVARSRLDRFHMFLLVPARTDTAWFSPLWGMPMCFVSGRLKFADAGNRAASNSAPFPVVIVYAGSDTPAFVREFAAYGVVGRFMDVLS